MIDTAANLPEHQPTSKLPQYAAQYWHKHFEEINEKDSSDGTIIEVVTLLHKLTTNTSNVSSGLEKWADHAEVYPEKKNNEFKAWYHTLLIWANKVSTLPEGSVNSEVEE